MHSRCFWPRKCSKPCSFFKHRNALIRCKGLTRTTSNQLTSDSSNLMNCWRIEMYAGFKPNDGIQFNKVNAKYHFGRFIISRHFEIGTTLCVHQYEGSSFFSFAEWIMNTSIEFRSAWQQQYVRWHGGNFYIDANYLSILNAIKMNWHRLSTWKTGSLKSI